MKFANEKELQIVVYPNPAKSDFTLSINNADNKQADIVVFDPLGKLVAQRKVNLATGENSTHFDSDEWPRGIYHIRIIIDDADSFENTVILN